MSRAGLVVLLAFSVEATFIPVFHEKSQPLCYPLSCFSLGSFARPSGKRGYMENFHPGSWNHNTGIPDKRAGSVVK